MPSSSSSPFVIAAALTALLTLGACSSVRTKVASVVTTPVKVVSQPIRNVTSANAYAGGARDRECLMRAMYFESIRSSDEGLLAVGSVVMNRVESEKFPGRVCAVVSQPRQFAPGVMTRRMQGDTSDLERLAGDILGGKRHPKIHPNVMFFHQDGLTFPYNNMHYVHVAGGNAFYEKRSRRRR